MTKRFLAFATAAVLLTGAVPAQAIDLNPLSAIKGAVEAAVEDRSAGDIAKDTEIKAKIAAAIADGMGTDVISFNVDVYEQDVMMTGMVDTAQLKAEAERIARTVEGVKMLYNDVMVVRDLDKDKGAVEGFVDDTVIETKINGLLLDARGVNVTNFRWRSVHGHVFLFGRALSAQERDKAAEVVKGIEGVRSLKNRVKIKPKG